MKLRPHHLLCTQGSAGKGYSDDFVQNMTATTNRFRTEAEAAIDIVFSPDDICEKCPHSDSCRDSDRIRRFDKKVTDYFCLEEKSCLYQDLVRAIKSKMTESMLEDICSDCAGTVQVTASAKASTEANGCRQAQAD